MICTEHQQSRRSSRLPHAWWRSSCPTYARSGVARGSRTRMVAVELVAMVEMERKRARYVMMVGITCVSE